LCLWQDLLVTIFEKEKLVESFGLLSFVVSLFGKGIVVFDARAYEAVAVMCRDTLEGASYIFTHRQKQVKNGHVSWRVKEPSRKKDGTFKISPLSEHMKQTMKILPQSLQEMFERIKDDGDTMAHFIENQEHRLLNFSERFSHGETDESLDRNVMLWMKKEDALADLRDTASILLTIARTMESQRAEPAQ